eukprot:scaffold302140_cov30-Tisochrysis_lutea.AAC.1
MGSRHTELSGPQCGDEGKSAMASSSCCGPRQARRRACGVHTSILSLVAFAKASVLSTPRLN